MAVAAIAAAEPVLLLAREPLAARLVQDPTEQLGVVVVAPAAEPVVAAVAAVVEREALGFELLRVLRLGLARAAARRLGVVGERRAALERSRVLRVAARRGRPWASARSPRAWRARARRRGAAPRSRAARG